VTRPFAAPHRDDARRHDPAAVFAAGLLNHHVSNTAYPLAHERTWRPYRLAGDAAQRLAVHAWDDVDDLCLYLHVPFCETRCSFCEYTVTRRDEHVLASQHVDDLLAEIAMWGRALGRRRLHGFDIGGGTPAFLAHEDIARLADAVRSTFDVLPGVIASIETTPRIAAREPEKAHGWRRAGFERVSMGIQVIEPDLLKVLNREANGIEQHARAVSNLRDAGFERFNVDLMYGFAGQSERSWEATLAHAIGLAPEAITLYRMRYKLTRISHQAPSVTLDGVRPLQRLAKAMLEAAGYQANPGKTTYSRIDGDPGTSSYLTRRVIDGMPYLGIGLGAQAFSPTTISYNDGSAGKNLAPHHRSIAAGRLPLQDLYDLPREHVIGKFCAVSFYFGEIDRAAFRAKFATDLEAAFPREIALLLERGLMEWTGRSLRLTTDGVACINGVIALFFAPSVQQVLLERDPAAATDFDRHRHAAQRVAGEMAHAVDA
jgi:oxygen-independent coproporphyrinogen-3 oxidase